MATKRHGLLLWYQVARLGAAGIALGACWFLCHIMTWMIVLFSTMVVSGLYEVGNREQKAEWMETANWMKEYHKHYFIAMYSIGSAIAGIVACNVYYTPFYFLSPPAAWQHR